MALAGFFTAGRLAGSAYTNSYSLPGTDSAKALSVLKADYPAQAGDSDQIVVQARQGTLRSAAAEAAVRTLLGHLARSADSLLPDVQLGGAAIENVAAAGGDYTSAVVWGQAETSRVRLQFAPGLRASMPAVRDAARSSAS